MATADPAEREEALREQLYSPGGLLDELMDDMRSLRREATVRLPARRTARPNPKTPDLARWRCYDEDEPCTGIVERLLTRGGDEPRRRCAKRTAGRR